MARCNGVRPGTVSSDCMYESAFHCSGEHPLHFSPVERLWTPWRRAYIEGAADDRPTGCFLCTAPALHDDRAALIVFRGTAAYVLLNLYPYNSGHLLVAPYTHTGDLATLD